MTKARFKIVRVLSSYRDTNEEIKLMSVREGSPEND
jgi:hypothetical protein